MIVEIPGEVTFSRTYNIPPVPVELPLVAHARRFSTGIRAVVGLCLTLPILAFWLLTIVYFGRLPEVTWWQSFVALTVTSAGLVSLLPPAINGIIDFMRSGPALILDQKGLTDRRGRINLYWTDIISVQINYMRHHTGVCLVMKNQILPRPLFDRGSTGFLGRRKANLYEVSVGDLSERAYVLSQTILVMVRQNGGTVKR